MFEFDFTTKEEYLEQRAAWKVAYKELSQEIRGTKLFIKNGMRNGDYVGTRQCNLPLRKG